MAEKSKEKKKGLGFVEGFFSTLTVSVVLTALLDITDTLDIGIDERITKEPTVPQSPVVDESKTYSSLEEYWKDHPEHKEEWRRKYGGDGYTPSAAPEDRKD